MSRSISFFVNRLFFGAVVLAALSSCNNVYLEQPMPQHGVDARSFPKEWQGVYEGIDENAEKKKHPNSSNDYFSSFLSIENIGDNKILVREEVRLHQKDFEKLRAQLEKEKKRGDISSFALSENFLMLTKTVEQEGQQYPEQQYINLFKSGEWYMVGQGAAPRYLFDFQARTYTEYEDPKSGALHAALVNYADTLAGNTAEMVVRLKDKAMFINIKQDEGQWRWFYITMPRPGELRIKDQELDNLDYFKANRDRYNSITPFTDLGDNDFRINPDDAAFEQLLADENLFKTLVLKKTE